MRALAIAVFAVLLPIAAGAATRSYALEAFDKVAVAAGVDVDITQGATRSVVAETRGSDFDDLRLTVKGSELRIDRPSRSWFRFWRRPDYSVRIVMPELRGVEASSGSEVKVNGAFSGDLEVKTSSGSDVEVRDVSVGDVRARSSSGSELKMRGSCRSLDAEASSGSGLDTSRLVCENVTVRASSGSDVEVAASRELTAQVSSGADVEVKGAPVVRKVNKSSGGSVEFHER